MTSKIDKGMILIATSAHAAHHALSLTIGQTVVHTIAACTRQTLYMLGLCPTPLLI